MKPEPQRLFLSRVSRDLGSHAERLRDTLAATGREGRSQPTFRQELDADTTLEMLNQYICETDAVLGLLGSLSGACPAEHSVHQTIPGTESSPVTYQSLLPPGFTRLTYTQWEIVLAWFWKRPVNLYLATGHPPDGPTSPDDDPALQAQWLDYLTRVRDTHPTPFANYDQLEARVLRDIFPKPRTDPGPPQACNLPYRSLRGLFIGRDAAMDQLHQTLHSGARAAGIHMSEKCAALHGLGGIGKTRLACEYAWQHASDYEALLFLNAETPASLESSLIALTGPLVHHLPDLTSADDPARRRAVLAWLQKNPKFLLIFDNIDDAPASHAVRDLLTEIPHGHLILTGRLPVWPEGVTPLHLDVLTPEDSARYLLAATPERRPHPEDEAQALLLGEQLGGLSLLLIQASAYINNHALTLLAYLELWQANHERLLTEWDEIRSHYIGGQQETQRTVFTTWQTTVDSLPPNALLLLHLTAWFAPDPIPEALLTDEATEELNAALAASPSLPVSSSPSLPVLTPDSLTRLIRSGLATRQDVTDERGTAAPGFVVHRVLQLVTRLRLFAKNPESPFRRGAVEWLDAAWHGDIEHPATWHRLDPLATHTQFLANLAVETESPKDDPGLALWASKLLRNLGQWHRTKGRILEARDAYMNAFTLRRNLLGPEHPNTVAVHMSLATTLAALGKVAEAEHVFRTTLSDSERKSGREHPDSLRAQMNLATSLAIQGRACEAEALIRTVAADLRRVCGTEHPDTLRAQLNLAAALTQVGKCSEAEPIARAVLTQFEHVYGIDHPDTLFACTNLAAVLRIQGKLTEAELTLRIVLADRERVSGADHPCTLRVCYNLSLTLEKLADAARTAGEPETAQRLLEEALSHAQRARDTARSVLGAENPDQRDYEAQVSDLEWKRRR